MIFVVEIVGDKLRRYRTRVYETLRISCMGNQMWRISWRFSEPSASYS